MPLTTKLVAKLTDPGRYGDGHGLYLQITPRGHRSWIIRYERGGRERAMGLGPVADFSLEEARERARKARQLLRDGIDPLDARNATRAAQQVAAAANVTFKECAEQYYNFHSPKWQNRKHAAQFLSTLETYAFPTLGRLPVAAIDKALVLKVVEPIWHTKTVTADRVRNRIERVLAFAKVQGYRSGDNPAAWTGNLEHALPAPGAIAKVAHHAALPFVDLPAFMVQLAARQGIAARALEFLILTAARTGEVVGARWDEIDLAAKVWTVPAARMKGRKEHRVPLTDRAVALLKVLPREADFVFPGFKKDSAVGNMSLPMVAKRMGYDTITVHGFRSAFRDWAAERTNAPNHVVEMALAHAIDDKVEAAYRRGDLYVKRTKLMADWARYRYAPPVAGSNVTVLRHG